MDKYNQIEEIRAVGYSQIDFFLEVFENNLEDVLTLEEEKQFLNLFSDDGLIEMYNNFISDNNYSEYLNVLPEIKETVTISYTNSIKLEYELIEKGILKASYYYIDDLDKLHTVDDDGAKAMAIDLLLDNMDYVFKKEKDKWI